MARGLSKPSGRPQYGRDNCAAGDDDEPIAKGFLVAGGVLVAMVALIKHKLDCGEHQGEKRCEGDENLHEQRSMCRDLCKSTGILAIWRLDDCV